VERILIIEDDKSIAELERDYLSISGFECDIAETGNIGLSMALANEYSLVIIDVMLPGRDGFSVCAELRKQKDLAIILLSARKEDIDKITGLGLGADDYMTKPFSPSELVARVKAHIKRHKDLTTPKTEEPTIEINGLKIDKNARRVFLNDGEVIMPAKEYDLLLFLMENPNRVFSKDILFDRIWGMDAMGDVSTVTVHIQRLRNKIEYDSSSTQYIETVWGAGYRFRC